VSVGRCPTERKPGVGVREGIHRQGTIARARVVLERALVAGTLDLSWGGSPLPVGVSTLERTPGSVRVDHSGSRGPARWGARPVVSAALERAWRHHWGARQGSAPTHPGSFRQSPLLGGGAHSRPVPSGRSAPMRETDSAREASPESLVELNPNFSGGSCPSSPLNADHLPPPPWHSKPVVSKSYPGCPSGHTPPPPLPPPGRAVSAASVGGGGGGRGGWSGSPLCASRRKSRFPLFPPGWHRAVARPWRKTGR